MDKNAVGFVTVGAVGIFLAHIIESKVQKSETIPYAHMSRIAFYWALGALAYFSMVR